MGAPEDLAQVPVGDPGSSLEVAASLDPEGVGRLHQRHELVEPIGLARQRVELVVQLVGLGPGHPHCSSSS